MSENISSFVIVGGGTAGWMAASALAKVVGTENCRITLVESELIGTVGVGEATIPPIGKFNDILGINPDEMLAYTHGTFKMGIEFQNWGAIGEKYIHPFGGYGADLSNVPFNHYWAKASIRGISPGLEAYSLGIQAAKRNKFMRAAKVENSPLSKLAHAFHFDAVLYAQYLRKLSESLGVARIEGVVTGAELDGTSGNIRHVCLQDGRTLEADFFIDCSGFKGVLIEQVLHTGYQDWSHHLPCNSALAVPCESTQPLLPYTKAIAHGFGWQWRIPLQHRTGNGMVYCDEFVSDDYAGRSLLANLDGQPQADLRQLRFTTGKRKKIWNKNCLAVGLSGGFLEPLESTSIHLIQSTIAKFLGLFPRRNHFEKEMERFNLLADREFEGIRDFLILHYKATRRDDSEFWNYCRTMPIPDSLQDKMDLYQSSAQLYRENGELFSESSWLAVLEGQGIHAQGYSPLADSLPVPELEARLQHIRSVIDKCLEVIPSHQEFIDKHCRSHV